MGRGRRRGSRSCALVGIAALALLGPSASSSQADDPQPADAPDACNEALALRTAKAVQAYYDGVRDLTADFEQTSRSVVLGGPSLADPETQRGVVVFAKPGKMRWSYREPEESLVVSDGATIWIHDVAAKQASKLAVTSGYLAGAALQFLLGEGDLVGTFAITPLRCGEDEVELDLLPREPATYERLGLTARPSTGQISDTTITDLFGNRTRIRFENVRVDLSPDAKLFEFEPPAGVEVSDLGAGN